MVLNTKVSGVQRLELKMVAECNYGWMAHSMKATGLATKLMEEVV